VRFKTRWKDFIFKNVELFSGGSNRKEKSSDRGKWRLSFEMGCSSVQPNNQKEKNKKVHKINNIFRYNIGIQVFNTHREMWAVYRYYFIYLVLHALFIKKHNFYF